MRPPKPTHCGVPRQLMFMIMVDKIITILVNFVKKKQGIFYHVQICTC